MAISWWRSREKRTKHCSRCDGLLPWLATYCESCGAGTPPPLTPTFFERCVRPYLGWTIAVLALAAVLIGGRLLKEHLDQRTRTIEQLQERRSGLTDRVDELDLRKTEAERKARGWAQLARKLHSVDKFANEERCRKDAEHLFDIASRLGEEIDAVVDELREVDAQLRGLGVSP